MKVEVKPKRKKTFGIMKSADVYAQERKDISNIEGSSIQLSDTHKHEIDEYDESNLDI